MVLQKRAVYGFNGYQVPGVPKRTRSARRRSTVKEDNQTSALDELASLAILLEDKNSAISSDNAPDIANRCAEHRGTVDIKLLKEVCLVKAGNLRQQDGQKQICCKASSSLSDNNHFGFGSRITSFDSSDRRKNEAGSCSYDSNRSNHDEITLHMNNNALENAGKVSGHLVIKNESSILGPIGSRDKTVVCEEDLVPQNCVPVTRDSVNLDSRDDDDENSECFPFSNPRKTFKCSCKDTAMAANVDADSTKKRLRHEKNYPIKKRKYLKCCSLSDNDDGTSCEAFSGSNQKVVGASDWNMNRGVSDSVTGESHVKFRIKSFKVPELFVEMPETATVGSLKRRVMEAVTAILGDGLHIGVTVQGKQIKDDSKTLIQTGISEDSHSEKLKFCLEPGSCSSRPHQFLGQNNSDSFPRCVPNSLTRYLPTKGNSVESVHGAADISSRERTKALVTVPAAEAKAISAVASGISKRFEAARRRIRRPFSVAEVESLVEAVEKLGTGRWRDVKMRAFDKSKHRTYVDLKDKWKTLVHTARISPQQRRGEPVPQELLDRVLAAHSYWSTEK